MKRHKKMIINSNFLKNTLLIGSGVAIFLLMIFNIKQNFVSNQAAGNPPVNITMQPLSANPSQEFTVNFNINGQKVTAAEMYFEFDPTYLEYFKEYNGGSGFAEIKDPGKENYFDVPLIEEVTSQNATTKQIKLVLVSKFNDPANPGWTTNVTGSLKFRAKQGGSTAVRINKTLTMLAGITNNGDATYFDPPTTDIQSAITISGSTTITPTTTVTATVPPTATPTGIPTITQPQNTLTPTTPVTTTPTGTVSPTKIPGNTTATPTKKPGFTVCNDDDDKDREEAEEDKKAGVNSVSAMDSKKKKRFDLLFIPEGYTKVEDFEADVKAIIAEFKDMKLNKRVNRKINFITYMDLNKKNDIKQCDAANGKKRPCWNKKKAKKIMHECDADGYMIVVNTPTADENPTKAREALEYWGRRTDSIWALGGGEALILRYDKKAIKKALAQAITGVLDNQTMDMWERALKKFQE